MSYRKENKFRVTLSDFYEFQVQLHKLGMKALFEPRLINSVYFDTTDLKMFNDSEEGVLPRKKVRIRWYGNSKLFALETKTSSVEGRFKVTTKLDNIIQENELLTRYRIDKQYGNIKPVLKVSYIRSYFVFNEMRITFDQDISYHNLRFASKRKYYDPERVIEIKTPINCSDDFIGKFVPFSTTRFSKYSRGLLLSLGDLNEI